MSKRSCLTPAVAMIALLGAAAPQLAAHSVTRGTEAVSAPVRVAPVPIRPAAYASASTAAAEISRHLKGVLAKSSAGLISAAVDIQGVGSVLRLNPDQPTPPASTEKLYTALALLSTVGPDLRLRTLVRVSGAVRPDVAGRLYLVGGGDPYLSGASLDAMAASVRAAGIRVIRGALVVDDLRYDSSHRAPGWKSAFVPEDLGPMSALAVDENGWRSDSSFLADPGMANLRRFRDLLRKHGVRVSDAVVRGRTPASTSVVTSHDSAPLSRLLQRMGKDSDNFAAELLLKELGLRHRGVGTTASGAASVRDVLRGQLGGIGTVVDGSGLSSRDRQSATGELTVLTVAEQGVNAPAFTAILPIACTDGTLVHRMCGTAAAGRVRAKTGTLPSVYSLSGYTTTADHHEVRFAFLLAQAPSSANARAAIDACVVHLSTLRVS